jgi:hypothetical protein
LTERCNGDDSKQADEGRAARTRRTSTPAPGIEPAPAELLAQYGCGPVQFSGTPDALYERHLLFDSVRDPAAAGPRERFEAVAHSGMGAWRVMTRTGRPRLPP